MTLEQKLWRSIRARSEEKAFSFLVFTHNLFVSVTKHFTRFHRRGKKLNGTIISSGYLKVSGSQKVLNGFFSRRCSRFHAKVFSPFFFLTQFQTLKKRSWKNKVFFWNIFLEKWKWKNILLKFLFLSSTHEKKKISWNFSWKQNLLHLVLVSHVKKI